MKSSIHLVLGVVLAGTIVTPLLAQASDFLPLSACAVAGGSSLSTRSTVTYLLQQEKDTVRVEAIVVARSQPGWHGLVSLARQPLVPPKLSGQTGPLIGLTLDTLFVRFDRKARVVWIHTLRVPLDSNNVVLIDRIDSRGGPPVVAGLARMPASLPLKGECEEKTYVDRMQGILQKLLKEIPSIANFIGR
jgi:hypothetical protein